MKKQLRYEEVVVKDVLTVAEVALYLRISERMVHEEKGKTIPCVRFHRRYLFYKAAIQEWLMKASRCEDAEPNPHSASEIADRIFDETIRKRNGDVL